MVRPRGLLHTSAIPVMGPLEGGIRQSPRRMGAAVGPDDSPRICLHRTSSPEPDGIRSFHACKHVTGTWFVILDLLTFPLIIMSYLFPVLCL